IEALKPAIEACGISLLNVTLIILTLSVSRLLNLLLRLVAFLLFLNPQCLASKIGRASCRERVYIRGVPASLMKNRTGWRVATPVRLSAARPAGRPHRRSPGAIRAAVAGARERRAP